MIQVEPMPAGFARRLKKLRGAAGLTQEGVARAAGLSLSAVTKLESGKIDPTWSTVKALARVLGVSVAAFEVDEPSEPEPPPAPRKRRK